jgi:hypothetical protein
MSDDRETGQSRLHEAGGNMRSRRLPERKTKTAAEPGARTAVPCADYPKSGRCRFRSSPAGHRWLMHHCRAVRGFGFHPHAGWPSRVVRQRQRCDSDRVADRPFALHSEALRRSGWSARLAPPVQAGVITGITGCPCPCKADNLPRYAARTRVVPAAGTEFQCACLTRVILSYELRKASQVPDFLRLTPLHCARNVER